MKSRPNIVHTRTSSWVRWSLLTALLFTPLVFACGDDDTQVSATEGALTITVTPTTASVTVTGPDDYSVSFTGNDTLGFLTPGVYGLSASASGHATATDTVNVRAGITSQATLNLSRYAQAEPPRYVYRNADGNLVSLAPEDVTSGRFVFYAWLQNVEGGIDPNAGSNPGAPLLAEQSEVAPSLTQNLVGGWVGFRDGAGVIRPVVGAQVRWEIDQFYADRLGSTQFGTSDGGTVLDDQAQTFTNNASLFNVLFPVGSVYPLYNLTGAGTPNIDGFTWVTLFSPDLRAHARVVAVATVFGVEIGKQILWKDFAPVPILEITKTVSDDLFSLEEQDSVEFRVVVRNIGEGHASSVDLRDFLSAGNGTTYALSALPEGASASGDGFNITFPLGAGQSIAFTFVATVTAPGLYCNVAQVDAYTGTFVTREPVDLRAQACFTAVASNLGIIKDFIALGDNPVSLGPNVTRSPGDTVGLRVRVTNFGSGDAAIVRVVDALTSVDGVNVTGGNADYAITLPTGAAATANDGFDITIASVAAGTIRTLLFTVTATADGIYCDTATVSVDGTNEGSSQACLTIASPSLVIGKVNSPTSVFPGDTYRSTIVVTNQGTATARGVVIADLLGINPDAPGAPTRVIYVSSSLAGVSGSLSEHTVRTARIDIPAGRSVTFQVFSLVRQGDAPGEYCNVASFASDNAGTGSDEACVSVPRFTALQTQLIDMDDPARAGDTVRYTSSLYVEPRSNESVDRHVVTTSFGLSNPTSLGEPGAFRHITTRIYLDSNPTRDPVTGSITSDSSSPSASLLASGADYTADNSTPGLEIVTFTPSLTLRPNQAFYLNHTIRVPSDTTRGQYTTSYIWEARGSDINYQSSSSESTTVTD